MNNAAFKVCCGFTTYNMIIFVNIKNSVESRDDKLFDQQMGMAFCVSSIVLFIFLFATYHWRQFAAFLLPIFFVHFMTIMVMVEGISTKE